MLTRDSLMSLEEYAQTRTEFRAQIMEHKKNRRVFVGDHAVLHFESQLSMQYQVQEMLRIERIFEADGIQEELDAYNPLIPDGNNWKATFMLEYPDIEERRVRTAQLIGIEDKTWVQVEGFDKVYGIADEDLDRADDEKTSAVHFMRYQLSDDMCKAVKNGANINVGIDHEAYNESLSPVPQNIRDSLADDIQLGA